MAENKKSQLLIKDSSGQQSTSVTLLWVAFIVTTLAYILALVDTIGPFKIRPFDPAACSTYFIPILTLYMGRRYTKAKFPKTNDDPNTSELLNG